MILFESFVTKCYPLLKEINDSIVPISQLIFSLTTPNITNSSTKLTVQVSMSWWWSFNFDTLNDIQGYLRDASSFRFLSLRVDAHKAMKAWKLKTVYRMNLIEPWLDGTTDILDAR